jgi:1,4-alpha-glucan branching enzyme
MKLQDQIERVIRAEHWDPFQVLGPHSITRNAKRVTLVRAFLPEALEASLLLDKSGKKPIPMKRVHKDGLFEATVPILEEKSPYRIRVKDRW